MAPGSSHKPRRKPHHRSAANHASPPFPLAAYFWPIKGTSSEWLAVPVILMLCALFRWVVGLWTYSGFQSPPMHGDFEAQRHWMELTIHLPVSRWYFYDLQWWGLDYPPLTAYHSWLLGKMYVASPKYFSKLTVSEGLTLTHLGSLSTNLVA